MTRISPEDEKASLTIHGPIAAMVPPAAAALSSERRVNCDAARWVATLDDTVLLGLFPDCDIWLRLHCGATRLVSVCYSDNAVAAPRANVPSSRSSFRLPPKGAC